MSSSHYKVAFKGEAGAALRAAFEELEVSTGHGVTVLLGDLPDQAALHAVLDRIQALGLDLIDVRLVVDERD